MPPRACPRTQPHEQAAQLCRRPVGAANRGAGEGIRQRTIYRRFVSSQHASWRAAAKPARACAHHRLRHRASRRHAGCARDRHRRRPARALAHGRVHQGRACAGQGKSPLCRRAGGRRRRRDRSAGARSRRRDRGDLRGIAGDALAAGGAFAGRRGHSRTRGRLHQGIRRGNERQPLFAHQFSGRPISNAAGAKAS